MKKIEVNCETGVETLLDCTEEEIAAVKDAQARQDAEQAAKEAAKKTVLDKLGLSADEVAALLG
jgi:hypothetical protein